MWHMLVNPPPPPSSLDVCGIKFNSLLCALLYSRSVSNVLVRLFKGELTRRSLVAVVSLAAPTVTDRVTHRHRVEVGILVGISTCIARVSGPDPFLPAWQGAAAANEAAVYRGVVHLLHRTVDLFLRVERHKPCGEMGTGGDKGAG